MLLKVWLRLLCFIGGASGSRTVGKLVVFTVKWCRWQGDQMFRFM